MVDNLLLVTTFPLYCINPVVKFSGLDATLYQQYCEAFVIVFVLPLAYVAHSATVWSTTLIGINRYVAVCHPYQVTSAHIVWVRRRDRGHDSQKLCGCATTDMFQPPKMVHIKTGHLTQPDLNPVDYSVWVLAGESSEIQ